MLDVNYIRKNAEEVKRGIALKNADPKLVDDFLAADEEWRKATVKTEELRAQLNKLSKKIAAPAGGGEPRSTEVERDEAKKVKENLKKEEAGLSPLEEKREKTLRLIPNPPLAGVPAGKDEKSNVVLREVGKKPKFSFSPKDYLALAENLRIIDINRAAKVSGSRFGFLLQEAVLLEFALVQLAMKKLSKHGFIPVIPPVLVKGESMTAMGYMDGGAEEIYKTQDDLYLVGTSEQSIGPMHKDEIFKAGDLPRRYVGFSTCFRREAGSYGKDTKGILRVHQFDKLEMFSYSESGKSAAEHEFLLKTQEELMQELKLPYRVVNIASGDLGDPAAAKYDIEVWLPGQRSGGGEYRETNSVSNATDYQARRLNIKYNAGQKNEFVHMLNGTAFAIGRVIIAILENYQTKKGTVVVPKALRKYVGVKEIK